MHNGFIFLYGPPGSGKSSVGRKLAEGLHLPFTDLDDVIESQAGHPIPAIFAQEGETGFRARELAALQSVLEREAHVVALGGGALLQSQARGLAEQHGYVVCLQASLDALLARLASQGDQRPLLSGNYSERLKNLLDVRAAHYRSFPLSVDTSCASLEEIVWQIQVMLGRFHVRGMGAGYDVLVEPGGLAYLGDALRVRNLKGPISLVSDENVAPRYAQPALESLRQAGFDAELVQIPAGEQHKNLDSIQQIWQGMVQSRLERGSTAVALGGGVVGDMCGFAAAAFLRGIRWVNVPTTLLAMVDSSLGGKTGIDLPQGKNLVGAFHPPSLVLADPQVLASLPQSELQNGLAETLKHGVIADPDLFARCAAGWESLTSNLDSLVRQGMAVKVKVIEVDPYEKGVRQALNLGHTIGHGVELASDFHLSHGQSVAIGMVAEAQLAEQLGIAVPGLADQISSILQNLGLPAHIPAYLSQQRIITAMQMDKKRAAGQVRFALPERIGAVRVGIEVTDWPQRIFETTNDK